MIDNSVAYPSHQPRSSLWCACLTRVKVSINAGEYFTCGILFDTGRVLCWGANVPQTNPQSELKPGSPTSDGALQLGVGHALTCAISRNHTLYCWGFIPRAGYYPGAPANCNGRCREWTQMHALSVTETNQLAPPGRWKLGMITYDW